MTSYEKLQAKCKKAMKATGMTEEETTLMQREAFGLYQYIGGDIPAENNRGTISRAVVIELVLDANRLELELQRKHPAVSKKLRRLFDAGKWTLVEDLIGPAFPYKEYEAGQQMEEGW